MYICTHTPYTCDHSVHFINSAQEQASFAFAFLNIPSRTQMQTTLDKLEWNEQQITSFEEKIYQTGTQYAYSYSDTDFVSLIIVIR